MNRRALMLAGVGMLAAAPLGGAAQAQPAARHSPDAALNLLMEGNARYVANNPRERDFSAGRASRAQGQAPFAAILASMVAKNELRVVGGIYDPATGKAGLV